MKRWLLAMALGSISLTAAPQPLWAGDEEAAGKARLDWFGSLRLRPEYEDNLTDLFTTNNDALGYVGYRANLGVSVGLDKGVSLVFDGQALGRWGEDQTVQKGSSTQSSITSSFAIFNAYADAHHVFGQPFSLRAGRQPLVFGDEWILGDSDFYGGTAWDGFRGDFDHKLGTISLFWAKIASIDSPETVGTIPVRGGDHELYGAWSTWKIGKLHDIDGAVLYNFDHRTQTETGGPLFTDKRWTATVRYHFGADRGGFANANAAYQWGSTSTPTSPASIDIGGAYAVELTGGYVWDKEGRPYKLWARIADYTGDDPSTPGSETYRDTAMDQHGRYGYLDFWGGKWGYTTFLGGDPGFQALQLGFQCSLPSELRLGGIVQKLQTEQRVDPASGNRNLGDEYALVLDYDYGKNLTLEAAFAQLYPGAAFRSLPPFGGSDTARRIYVNSIVRF